MNNRTTLTRKHTRNVRATRVGSAVLCLEQAIYGFMFAESGSVLQRIYFSSSLVLGILFLISMVLPRLVPIRAGVLYDLFDMLALGVGLGIAYVRMLYAGTVYQNIPTIYLAVLFGGAVIFLLDYKQSLILYTSITVVSIIGSYSRLPLDPTVPFRADFLVNEAIAWAVSALTYASFLKTETQREIIEEKNRQLTQLSELDWLTNLYNRRKLDVYLVGFTKYQHAILFDLDFFKTVNDNYGHQKGDRVLIELASILKNTIKSGDVVGRWGGEEFLILTHEDGLALAEQLRHAIEIHQFADTIPVTASFGVTACKPKQSVHELIKCADRNLYQAKQMGRNQVVYS
ncbi:MAG: GGDEF domain-containing protein [Spirochaetia bacterium]|nr:GGDEF domain-containing protein [Spirochaetia bacterium]NCC89952.1 GGDEF domain-containing protein [Spirochaetia bacterium]